MSFGFQTWKDVVEVLIIPVLLALIALLWPEVQLCARRRAFSRLILRELQELAPFPATTEKGKEWFEHLRKEFIHQKIFESPSENRDFILSLPPDMVYDVSQLWSALKNRDEEQWLFYLGRLANPETDKTGDIKKAHQEWGSLIAEYDKIESHHPV